MIELLKKHLSDPQLINRLRALAGDATASVPVSLTIELGKWRHDWLNLLPKNAPYWYQARPTKGIFRLGIGHALNVSSEGKHRFAALDNAYHGLCQHWRHTGKSISFIGFAFDKGNTAPLPNALLAIPSIFLESDNGTCSLTISVPAGRLDQAKEEWLGLLTPRQYQTRGRLIQQAPNVLAERAWIARVNAALRDIQRGTLSKLVLSRQRTFESDQAFSPQHILQQLINQQPDSMIYAHGNAQHCFLGATPERLVSLDGQDICADALAGTAWGESAELTGEKNRHEQSLVVEAVCQALSPYCEEKPTVSPAAPYATGNLAHLRSEITAQAANGTRIFDLIRALHPTPAVGGYPSTAALDWLSRHNEQRPGWYSGCFGTLDSRGNGELFVALRSALLHGKTAYLQAGAGIVAGSQAAQELAETEAKIGTLLAALQPETAITKNATGS